MIAFIDWQMVKYYESGGVGDAPLPHYPLMKLSTYYKAQELNTTLVYRMVDIEMIGSGNYDMVIIGMGSLESMETESLPSNLLKIKHRVISYDQHFTNLNILYSKPDYTLYLNVSGELIVKNNLRVEKIIWHSSASQVRVCDHACECCTLSDLLDRSRRHAVIHNYLFDRDDVAELLEEASELKVKIKTPAYDIDEIPLEKFHLLKTLSDTILYYCRPSDNSIRRKLLLDGIKKRIILIPLPQIEPNLTLKEAYYKVVIPVVKECEEMFRMGHTPVLKKHKDESLLPKNIQTLLSNYRRYVRGDKHNRRTFYEYCYVSSMQANKYKGTLEEYVKDKDLVINNAWLMMNELDRWRGKTEPLFELDRERREHLLYRGGGYTVDSILGQVRGILSPLTDEEKEAIIKKLKEETLKEEEGKE